MRVCFSKSKKMNFPSTLQNIKAKCFLLLIFFTTINQSSFAQSNNEIDSLLNVLNTSKEDFNRVKALLELSSGFHQMTRYADSKKYAEEALALAEKLDFKKEMGSAYSMIANNIFRSGNYVGALKYQQQALSIRKAIGDSSDIASSYLSIGHNYITRGKYAEALENYLASLKIREKLGDKKGIAECYNAIGDIYVNQSQYNEALKYIFASLHLNEEIGNKWGVAVSYNNIGDVYKKQGNYVEAVKNHMASMKIREENGYKTSLGTVYTSLGDLYFEQRKFNESLKYHQASMRIAHKRGSKIGLIVAYQHIGEDYIGLEKFTPALDTLLLAKTISEEIGNKVRLSACLSNIGKVWMKKGHPQEALKNFLASLELSQEENNKLQIAVTSCELGKTYIGLNQPSEARDHLMKGLSISKEIGVKATIQDAYEGLAQLESETGNYQQAFIYHQLYTAYKDSLMNEDSERQIAMLKEQYESEKKDKDILQLTGEKQISALLLKTKQDSLNFATADKQRVQFENLSIKLENEKFYALNLSNQQQLELLGNEKQLQILQSEKDKAEADKNKEQLALLNKEREVQELKLKKEKLTKNYFIGGLGLFLVLSFFIYRNYRTRQEVKLLTLRNKIAIDLHDDVGSTLSSISMFSQMAQAQSKEVIPALETIGESSRKMLDAMADIVWTIKPENDEFDKVIMRMREFAFELLGTKAIDFEFDAGDDIAKINLSMEARKNLYLIFKEATNNMVKYSEAKRAKFALKGEKDKLMMVISDNGKGFDATKESRGNGLVNMKKRAVEMGAQLFIDSTPGRGTTIRLDLAV